MPSRRTIHDANGGGEHPFFKSMTTSATFTSLWNSMTEARAMLRKGRVVVETALASGIERTRQDSEYGQSVGTGTFIRCLEADLATAGIGLGDAIEAKMASASDWRSFRVSGLVTHGGVARLALEAEFA